MNAISPVIIPQNESERSEAVRRYDILDTPPDGAFDRITAIAARRFDVPISIISIVDHDRMSARRAVAQAQMMAKEIDHRVINSLQFISGMLSMQSRAVDENTATHLQ